ncbi:MAG: hypothetical protein FWG38_11555, partial [Defluviitaleaceae bacterium]|nr:hypothetical protein [Defluviitaleaceae bacterium]
ELLINEVAYERRTTERDFPVALSDLTAAPLMPHPSPSPSQGTSCADYILAPTRGEGFPAVDGGWISNMAIIDGHLHIQMIAPLNERASSAFLLGSDGEHVPPVSWTFIHVDPNLEFLTVEEMDALMEESLDDFIAWIDASYGLLEVVYPIDVNALDTYALRMWGMDEGVVRGDWSMTIYTGHASEHMRAWHTDVNLDDTIIQTMTVSPLGVGATGIVTTDIHAAMASMHSAVWVETSQGNVMVTEFALGRFSQGYGKNATFSIFARADSPIDVVDVTAVIIGDVRIPVEYPLP